MKVVVPQGAEANAVRRVVPQAAIVAPGAAAGATLPPFAPGETAVVVGLCGALTDLSAGQVVIYARVRDNARKFELDARLVETLQHALPSARVVTACTTRTVITRVEAKAALAQRFEAEVVDMEGTHLAAELAARGVRYAMVRVVSDDAAHNLPPIEQAIGSDGRLRPLYLAFAFARAPRAAARFVRDARTALATLSETARTIAAL